MPERGTYGFGVTRGGRLKGDTQNRERLRRLFRDSGLIQGRWGPGNSGDFDHDSCHILCHLAGGSRVLRTRNGIAWCAITHAKDSDSYAATVTFRTGGQLKNVPVQSREGQELAVNTNVVGFLEGTFQGHIAARCVVDPQGAFNGWPRQLFDQNIGGNGDGGAVWELWCTARDISNSKRIGTSVTNAYLTVASVLGGRFIAAVARGRRQHEHPAQLVARVKAGLLTAEEGTWDITPQEIPFVAQKLLYEVRPADCLAACEQLAFQDGAPTYHMFSRRISQPLLLNPEIDDPCEHLEFATETERAGIIRAVEVNGQPSERGLASIEVYALDTPQLIQAREAIAKRFHSHLRNTRNTERRHNAQPDDALLKQEYDENMSDLLRISGLD